MFLFGKTQKKHPGTQGPPNYGTRPAPSTHPIKLLVKCGQCDLN